MRLFKRIFKHPISIHGPRVASNLCNDQARFAMQKLWAMIEWEHGSFVRDCRRMDSLDDWMTNHSKWERFYVRNVARLTSYINLVCNLEDIMQRCFDETIDRGNRWFPKPFKPRATLLKKIQGDQTLKVAREYRNKLTAHTAYAKPKLSDKKENISTRLTSLLYVQGGSFSGKDPASFHFGGTQIVVGGKDGHYFREQFGIHTHHAKVESYFRNWENLICSVLKHYADQCPIQKNGCRIVSRIEQLNDGTVTQPRAGRR